MKLCTHSHCPYLLSPSPWQPHFISMNLPILDISYKWNYTECVLCVLLFSFSIMFSEFTYVLAYISIPFLLWLNSIHHVDISHFVCFISCWMFGLFPFEKFAILNNAVMKICAQVFVPLCFQFSQVYT